MSQTLIKLTIKSEVGEFTAPINPASYDYKLSTSYTEPETIAIGSGPALVRYASTKPQEVSFDLMLDDTGVIYDVGDSNDIISQIKLLKKVAYNYNGDIHRPNAVTLIWDGNFKHDDIQFRWGVTSMNTSFSLFAPSGKPLRAKVSLHFMQILSPEEISKIAKPQSPDMTHYRIVRKGDTLPMMCEEIYKNSSLYVKVAAANGLSNFRKLEPGTKLMFPPLVR